MQSVNISFNELREAGIECRGPVRGRNAVSVTVVQPDGEGSLVFDPGDSRSITPDDLDDSCLDGADALYLSGHHFYSLETRGAWLHIARAAKSRDIPLAIDLAAANRLMEFGSDNFVQVLKRLKPTFVFGNEAETIVFRDEVVSLPLRTTFVAHRGTKSTVLIHGSTKSEFPVQAIDSVDTTGAGDAFAGGFLAAYVQGKRIETCVGAAHRAGGQVVTSIGARPVSTSTLEIGVG